MQEPLQRLALIADLHWAPHKSSQTPVLLMISFWIGGATQRKDRNFKPSHENALCAHSIWSFFSRRLCRAQIDFEAEGYI
jgi:hypothetical protein